MSTLSILFLLASSGTPSPDEVMRELDANPWHPAPAAPVAAESTSRIGATSRATASQSPKAPTKDAPATGSWQLQLGALSTSDAANAEKKRLEKILGSGTVEILVDGGVHKLRYGGFGTKEEAETARAGLKAKGIDGFAALRP